MAHYPPWQVGAYPNLDVLTTFEVENREELLALYQLCSTRCEEDFARLAREARKHGATADVLTRITDTVSRMAALEKDIRRLQRHVSEVAK